jgi:predicted nucleotidyltransferase
MDKEQLISIKNEVRIYDLKDPKQYEDEKLFWDSQTIEYKLEVLESLRENWAKINDNGEINENFKGLRRVFELLNKNDVKYMIVGSYALSIYSKPRFTNDIDVFILVDRTNSDKMIKSLLEFGFEHLDITAEDLNKPDQIIQLGYAPNRIDILTSIDGVNFSEAYERRTIGKYGGQIVNFISKDDLIINKKTTGRKKDLDDLEYLNS